MTECRVCGGQVAPKKVDVYRNWRGGFVIITGVPAHVCAQCGEQYFDAEVALGMDRIKKATRVPGETSVRVPVRPYAAEVQAD